jgi:acyl-CoA hydrolase
VDSYVEPLAEERRLINRAYLVFVALDANGRPTTFKPFVPKTPEEIAQWEAAEMRRTVRLTENKG